MEDDWEYEYHDSDTESFFLNLDLSSQGGPLRPRQTTTTTTTTTTEDEHETDFARPLTTTESDHHHHPSNPSTDRLQILALHTLNPIISYQNQIFTCSWADLLGTELLFTSPHQELDSDSVLVRGTDFDLIAANSVKILGRKANLISSSGVTVSEPSTTTTTTSSSTPTTATTNQARFLERLAAIKQDRGETDTVRTVFSTRRSQNTNNPEDRLRGWARTEEQMLEIQRLQDAVLRGDSQALAALEEML